MTAPPDPFQDPAVPADGGGVHELPPEAEARLQSLIAEQKARRDEEASHHQSAREMWLAHHWPDEYERCAVVGGRHVCRRCLTLYPIAIAVMIASLAGLPPWPERLDVWFIWLLCIPATLDFLGEKLRDVPYHPTRQIVVTALVGVALGRGLAHEIDDRWSWLFWGPVLVFGGLWFLAAVAKAQRVMFARALEASIDGGDFADASGDDEGH